MMSQGKKRAVMQQFLLLLASLIASLFSANAAIVHVKVAPGFDASVLQKLGTVTPLFTLPIEWLKKLCEVEPGLPDLTLWYSIVTPVVIVEDEEADLISIQSIIMDQYADIITYVDIPKIVPPPDVTPDLTTRQNYLLPSSATNNGIDAEYSWTLPGGDGAGIMIYDVEYAWNLLHEDLEVMHTETALVSDGDEAMAFDSASAHGTAVLGVLVGTANAFGVTGISPGARARVAPEWTKLLGGNRPNAIMLAVDDALKDGIPNDVILLEMQNDACGEIGFGPAEENLGVFEATQVAVANGIVVVAAAGNGSVNLDDPLCESKYDRTKRDSGAIIVGAGGSGRAGCSPARTIMGFSTYGSRVDVHGWGDCVWTAGDDNTAVGDGYFDSTDPLNKNKWYSGTFAGTSSASPIVAAAAANIQGIAMQKFGKPLKPRDVRKLLHETGLPQLGDTGRPIGPLVNLRRAIDELLKTAEPTRKPTKPRSEPKPTRGKNPKSAKKNISDSMITIGMDHAEITNSIEDSDLFNRR